MTANVTEAARAPSRVAAEGTVFGILLMISISHMLNDTIQSLIPAIYPVLKESYDLDFGQIGLITLTFQLTASLFQPFVGIYTDLRPKPYSLPVGMACTLAGLVLLSQAETYPLLLLAAGLVGLGSSVFHPEASRVARMASGGRYGLAQSVFQVGGNGGSALGPLLAAFIVVPHGQESIVWFTLVALAGIVFLSIVGRWYQQRQRASAARTRNVRARATPALPRRTIVISLAILATLTFSKFFYMASIGNYYTFYLIDRFGLTAQDAQIHLFVFLAAVAVGTLAGGPIGDRIGRKYVIWFSILGVLPFTLMLPHASLFWTGVLSVVIGLILSSAFSAILVYGQELVPGKPGMIGGLFFGFAFGMGGLGAAALGELADLTSIRFVYEVCAFLPLIGILTVFLPNIERAR